MMLRNKKVVIRPAVNSSEYSGQTAKFFVLFLAGLMCYVYNYENKLFNTDIVLYNSTSMIVKEEPLVNISVRVVPKPDILFYSPNQYLADNLTDNKLVLESLLFSLETVQNRTDAMLLFAENVSYMANNEKNTLVIVREFCSGKELEPVVYYSRPVDEILEAYLIW